MLARKETQLTVEIKPRFMNQELQQFFPQRTIEAIKGKTRNEENKNMVQRYTEELVNPAAPPDLEPEDVELGEDGTEFLDLLESLKELKTDDFQGKKLHKIAMEARTSGREATLQKVSLYLRDILPAPQQLRNKDGLRIPTAPRNKKEVRRREYGQTQALWTKDRSHCINNTLEPMGHISPEKLWSLFGRT